MRRNSRGGRGGQPWQNNSRISGGPLITDQSDLQDIDKELELLQRKRKIIEQQQNMISNEFRRNDYQQPYRTSYNESSRYNDNYTTSQSAFSDMRDYNPPNSRKRPIPVWEDEIPSKRFSGPTRSKSRPFGRSSIPPLMRSGPTYTGGCQDSLPRQSNRPLSGPFKPKPRKAFIPKKGSNVPKVIKSTASPNKPNSSPVAERKVTETVDEASEGSSQGDFNRLCSDREPSKQVVGRLELALGSIIKEIKAADPDLIKSASVLREIKTVVRERIREVMMNRPVNTADAVKAQYRQVYNTQSDVELVANAIYAHSPKLGLIEIDDPEKYFKANMHQIMQYKLKSLFDKLEEVSLAESKKSLESVSVSDTIMDVVEEGSAGTEQDEEIKQSSQFLFLEKWFTQRLTLLLKKFLPFIIRLMDSDHKYSKLKNMITAETVKMLKQRGLDADASLQSNNASLNSSKTGPKSPLPYFAKLIGKPALPKRNQMEPFFAEFKPKSIKKHRTVFNLLFVGFVDKESFDLFLAADGTKIGKHTLHIKISERNKPDQNNEESKILNESISSDKLFGSELDDQITDLLSCIRQGEENGVHDDEVKDGETDAKNEDAGEKTVSDATGVTTANADENKQADENNAENADAEHDNTKIAENAEINEAENVKNNEAENAENNEAENVATNEAGNAETNGAENAETAADENDSENTDTNNAGNVDKNNDTEDSGNGDVLIKEVTEISQENNGIEKESADTVPPLDAKPLGRSTPMRASARLAATPGRVQTRRASRLAQNDA